MYLISFHSGPREDSFVPGTQTKNSRLHPSGCPRSIRAGGKRYAVLLAKPWSKDANAEVDVEKLEVRIDPTLGTDLQRFYLWHECIHIAWDEADLPPRVAEETVARRLAPAISTLLRDNPSLRKFVLGGK